MVSHSPLLVSHPPHGANITVGVAIVTVVSNSRLLH